jgi:TonB family protein
LTTTAPQRELHSELARWSLVSSQTSIDGRLSWTNSILALFLAIGLVGARTHPPPPKVPPPLEEAAPVIIEPLPPPPATENTAAPEPTQPDQSIVAPSIVVPNAPSINFSVPTVGTLVAPVTMAAAPAAQSKVRESEPAPLAPTVLQTGAADRPAPSSYPEGARLLGQQGTVTLLMTGDAAGNIVSMQIQQSSGSSILDHAAEQWVKRHWKLPPGPAGREFEAGIQYLLTR